MISYENAMRFLDGYKKERMFSDGLDEFDEARSVVSDLVDEYRACEQADYVERGQ